MVDFNLPDIIELLQSTPKSIVALVSELPTTLAEARKDKSWNIKEIVAHLLDGEHTDWMPRAQQILGQSKLPFTPYDRVGFNSFIDQMNVAELLQKFVDMRERNVNELCAWNISTKQLQWKGIHPDFGEVTLEQLLSAWAVHDLSHLRQISTIIAHQYSVSVGPWDAYLGILDNKKQ